MGAIGMEGKEIVKLFFLEASYLGVIGAAIGVFLGYLISIPLTIWGIPLFDNVMEEAFSQFEVSGRLYITVGWGTALYIFVYASLVASFSSFFPSLKASRIQVVDALREE